MLQKCQRIRIRIAIIIVLLTVFTGCGRKDNSNSNSSSGIRTEAADNNDGLDVSNPSGGSHVSDDTNVNKQTQKKEEIQLPVLPDEIQVSDRSNGSGGAEEESTPDTENKSNHENDKSDKSRISLVMVGDILLHTSIHESGKMEDGSYNYDHLFANVKEDIDAANLALVNQEVILGGSELGLSGYPSFNGAFEVGDSLVKAGFDVILHATNHTLDKGRKGVLNCMNFWSTKYPGISVLGINESQEAQDNNIYVYEQDGIRLAILNYTYGTNGISLPSDMPYIVNLIDKDRIAADVKKADELADFIIVAPHWGTEYQHQPSKSQKSLAAFLADIGVDLVIGTHPHVVQPVEWVESENGNRMLVYYSIGNFINSTAGTGDGVADRMVGAMAQVTIGLDENGEVSIEDYGALPLVTHMKSGRGRITTYKFSDYSEEMAKENDIMKQDSSFTYEYCVDVWNSVFPEFEQEYVHAE